MPCPECKAEDRLCIRNGFAYRKTTIVDGTAGARVQRYQCTKCGHIFTSSEMDRAKDATEIPDNKTSLVPPPCTIGEGVNRIAQHKEGIVSEISIESDRILLYLSGKPDYHVIAGIDAAVAVGDTIEYTPEGVNFGWLASVVQKGGAANVSGH